MQSQRTSHLKSIALSHIALFFFLTLLSACTPTGKQGEPFSSDKILVTGSSYIKSDVDTLFRVEYEFTNNQKTPTNSAWDGLALVDKEGRIFAPSSGINAVSIQPLGESGALWVEYSISPAVDVNNLWWCQMENGKINWKIKLEPREMRDN